MNALTWEIVIFAALIGAQATQLICVAVLKTRNERKVP